MRCLRSLSQAAQSLADTTHPVVREACALVRTTVAQLPRPDPSP